MSYTDKKITQEEINAHHVQGVTDYLIGNAQQNKAVFDDLPEFIAGKFNDLIDEIAGQHGDEIRVAVIEWLDEHPEATTTVQDNSLTTAKYVDGSVTEPKIANVAVTEPKIAEGAVTPSKLDRAYSTTTDLASVNENLTNELNVLDARMDEFASLPEGSTSGNAELIDIRVDVDGKTYQSAGGAVRGQVADLKNDLYPRMKAVDGQYAISKADFDIGNIQITNSGWNYNDWNNRVRTKQGCEMHLKVGDVIHFTDYTALRYYLGWKKSDNTYGSQGWITSDFTVTVEGDYVFLISTVPEVSQTSVDALVSRLTITSADSMKADLTTLDSQVSKDGIRTKAVREGIVYTTAGHHDLYLYVGETVDINVTALSSRTNAYINTDSSYSIPINTVGKYTFTARSEGYLANYAFGASDFSMNMEVCLRTRYDDALDDIHAEINDTSYYTVDVNGNGDYTSFTACIEALESDSSKKVITVLEGDYDIYSEIGGSAYVDSLTGTDWRSVNAIVPPNTIIRGVGDVNLLYLPDTAAEVGKTLISPLNLSGNVEVHNINIHCQNCRYAIHLEGSAIADFDNANILLDNVNIVRDKALYARQVLGSGLNKGCTLIVRNCTWENTDSQNFYVHTNSLIKHPRIIVENCQFITHGTSSFYFSSENKIHDGEVLVRLNSVYANNANITKADIQNGDCFRVVANGCNLLTQSTFNTGYPMNSLDQYLTIS